MSDQHEEIAVRPHVPTIAALGLALSACAAPAVIVVAPPTNPFTVPVPVAQAGSRIYDSLRACGQPGVDLTIGRADEIATSPVAGPFAGMRVRIEPAYPDALITVLNAPITPVLLARVRGWAVNGPDC
jgi:hypothetical protein